MTPDVYAVFYLLGEENREDGIEMRLAASRKPRINPKAYESLLKGNF